jgi:anti-sigma regulatory factor (Ser/Thr protein kinase)
MTAAGFDHRALPYVDDQAFLAGTVPFVLEGLADEGAVLAALGPRQTDLLHEALGPEAERVEFVAIQEEGRNPARIIPVWSSFVERHPGRPLRGIGEPVWPGRSGEEIVECEHHEALLDLAFADGRPWSLLCPYDASALPTDVVERAVVGHANGPHRPGLLADPLTPVPAGHHERAFDCTDADLRGFLRSVVAGHGLSGSAADEFLLAIHEIATNSIRHGGGRGVLRLWATEGAVVAEVTDLGRIDDPLVGRRAPTAEQIGGRGVWISNALCDLVQIRSTAAATTVRLHRRIGLQAATRSE